MFPPGNLDLKKMEAMMRQMGIKMEKVSATRVIIETSEGKIVIENPAVVKTIMQDQQSFQVNGAVKMEMNSENAEDVRLVMDQANCSEDEARKALQAKNGDIAEAIILLSEKSKE